MEGPPSFTQFLSALLRNLPQFTPFFSYCYPHDFSRSRNEGMTTPPLKTHLVLSHVTAPTLRRCRCRCRCRCRFFFFAPRFFLPLVVVVGPGGKQTRTLCPCLPTSSWPLSPSRRSTPSGGSATPPGEGEGGEISKGFGVSYARIRGLWKRPRSQYSSKGYTRVRDECRSVGVWWIRYVTFFPHVVLCHFFLRISWAFLQLGTSCVFALSPCRLTR